MQFIPRQPRQGERQQSHLFTIANGACAQRRQLRFNGLFAQAGPDLGQNDGRVLPGLKRPDGNAACAPEPVQHRQAHQYLPAHCRRKGKLKTA